MVRTAAALIVGDEILTGKVQECNLGQLAAELFGLGIRLKRAVICPDAVDAIARDVLSLKQDHDFVFTSGGVGPTHDDVTLPAVAKALGRPLALHHQLAHTVRQAYGTRCNDNHLRMAHLPEGTKLIFGAGLRWPVISVDNLFILPGVPEVFRLKLAALREHLRQTNRFVTRAVYTRCDEGEIADLMSELSRLYPSVAIGSYVKWQGEDYSLKVTFDAADPAAVDSALHRFVQALSDERLVRVE